MVTKPIYGKIEFFLNLFARHTGVGHDKDMIQITHFLAREGQLPTAVARQVMQPPLRPV